VHDGTQQRLVALKLELRQVASRVSAGQDELQRRVEHSTHELADIIDELREISRGIHPAILSHGGIEAALKALARRSGTPATCVVGLEGSLGEQVEVAVYYVVSEALANAKHSGAPEEARRSSPRSRSPPAQPTRPALSRRRGDPVGPGSRARPADAFRWLERDTTR
jgi:signal transduction histidine kinase